MPDRMLLEKGQNGRKLAEIEFDKNIIGKKYFEFLSEIMCNR